MDTQAGAEHQFTATTPFVKGPQNPRPAASSLPQEQSGSRRGRRSPWLQSVVCVHRSQHRRRSLLGPKPSFWAPVCPARPSHQGSPCLSFFFRISTPYSVPWGLPPELQSAGESPSIFLPCCCFGKLPTTAHRHTPILQLDEPRCEYRLPRLLVVGPCARNPAVLSLGLFICTMETV